MSSANDAINDNTFSPAITFRAAFGELMKGVHTMLPGLIESFDAGTQRAKVALAYASELDDGSLLPAPALIDVPVMFYRWGGYVLTAPVTAGDECIVVFSERSLSRFKQFGDTGQAPTEERFFDLSDGYCMPGSMSAGKALDAFNTSEIELRTEDGTTTMALGSGTLLYQNGTGTLVIQNGQIAFDNGANELVDLFSQTLQQLSIETVTPGSPGTPVSLDGAAVYANLKLLVDAFKI